MRNYLRTAAGGLLIAFLLVACSEEPNISSPTTTAPTKSTVPSTTSKVFIYNNQAYTIPFDEQGDYIPTTTSDALLQDIVQAPDLTAFTFLGKDGDKTYLFDTEMEGYKYIEQHIDKRSGRQLQVGHATNLLRDQLIQKYGTPPLDYSNPSLQAEAQAGIAAIYQKFKIVGTPPKNAADFMGVLGNNTTKNTNNNSWQLWEHPIQNGEVFDIETEPNVWSWVHGDWDCNITYAAMNLDWNYRQNNQSWNDCISSYCFDYQPGADAMCFGVYKDAMLKQGHCAKLIYHLYPSQWVTGGFTPCYNNLTNIYFGGLFCNNLDDDISSLRMQIVWQGCPVDFTDF